MGTTPFKLQPQTGYLVAASPDYAGIVQEWLVDYYQPLLSPTALSLLLALSGRLVPNPMPAERHQHTVLLDQLGWGLIKLTRPAADWRPWGCCGPSFGSISWAR